MIHDGQIILILNLIQTQNYKWEKCGSYISTTPRHLHEKYTICLSKWTLTEFNRYDLTPHNVCRQAQNISTVV